MRLPTRGRCIHRYDDVHPTLTLTLALALTLTLTLTLPFSLPFSLSLTLSRTLPTLEHLSPTPSSLGSRDSPTPWSVCT
mgnify:CR=1 FL=1